MWNYEKRLQYPISISTPNAKMASFIISQYGGPDGEMGASMRYLAQRFSFANPRIAGVLTDLSLIHIYLRRMINASLSLNTSFIKVQIFFICSLFVTSSATFLS